MRCILSFALIILYIQAYSQPIAAERKIKLAAGSFTSKKVTASIAGITVLPVTAEPLTLGYVAANTGNETIKLLPEATNAHWLDTLVVRRYSPHFTPKGNQLVWVMRSVSVTTDTSGQHYFTRLKAAVYNKSDVHLQQCLLAVDTVLEGKLVNDNSFVQGITNALDQLFLSSANNNTASFNNTLQPGKLISEKATTELAALPVVKDNQVTQGAYASFQEFTNNTPSVTGPLWAVPDTAAGNGHVKLFVMEKDSSAHLLSDMWGICFGGNELYKYENGLLVPIEKSGNGFILSRYQQPAQRKNQAMYWRRIASNAWRNDTNPFERSKSLVVKSNQADALVNTGYQPVATCIDMTTGELTF